MVIPTPVLLVEDNIADAYLLMDMLKEADEQQWQVVQAKRLSSALEYLRNSHFDIILLDLTLPDSKGLNTVTQIQAAARDLPIVVLTGLDDQELAVQAVALGAQDYLVKGEIATDTLMRAIRYAMERGRILQQLQESERRTLIALEKERELNQLKSSFVSMVSHEFRTPMTTIRLCAEKLQGDNPQLTPERRNQYLDLMQGSIADMLQLLDEVLFLGRIDTGGLHYEPTTLNLEDFCCELTETLQLSASDRKLTFTCQGDCTQAVMDAILLRHIFTNLLSNAIKYSRAGSTIQFGLTCEDSTATFQIQDQGIGIPVSDRKRLFETFHRATNVGSIQGTGLGLSIVKKCVDLHQGQIQIESEVNVGTTVTVTLSLGKMRV
ncbi:MAG TPA: hybrid sensor histidine kinase/response regulator [Cyanobacteria bacterium UBA8803]|nr:hybrid sensor histidine kinase/response regulator [Cyanobacteria bacterium UBA9273]HBL62220.1 hybrid sensor histidine kinase/response regulator [Cyanobacteria bacterium UBA8803]